MIPSSVLKRRPGIPIARRYAHGYITGGWPNGGSSLMDLDLVQYRVGRRRVTYWMHRYGEWRAGGECVTDTWRTYTDKTLPVGLRGLNDARNPWVPLSS